MAAQAALAAMRYIRMLVATGLTEHNPEEVAAAAVAVVGMELCKQQAATVAQAAQGV